MSRLPYPLLKASSRPAPARQSRACQLPAPCASYGKCSGRPPRLRPLPRLPFRKESCVSESPSSSPPPIIWPGFITAPGVKTDILMIVVGIIILIGPPRRCRRLAILPASAPPWPERMAHKSQKLQFEIRGGAGLAGTVHPQSPVLGDRTVPCDWWTCRISAPRCAGIAGIGSKRWPAFRPKATRPETPAETGCFTAARHEQRRRRPKERGQGPWL